MRQVGFRGKAEKTVEFCTERPIYVQIGTDIKEQILRGSLRPDEKLPSVREYSVKYEVSPLTIQRAMQYLEQQGVIYSQKGVGNFVQARAEERLHQDMIGQEIRDFVEKLKKRGLTGGEIIEKVRAEVQKGEENDAGSV